MTDTELQALQVKVRLAHLDTDLRVIDMAQQLNLSVGTVALCFAACERNAARCRLMIPMHWEQLRAKHGGFYESELVASIATAMGKATP